MKALMLLLAFGLFGCAKPPADSVTAPAAKVAGICQTYDACTYSGGLGGKPVFECLAKTLQLAQHPEIPLEYFQGQSCLTYKEDFHTQYEPCGPNFAFSCPTQIQGPGPKAIPALNL